MFTEQRRGLHWGSALLLCIARTVALGVLRMFSTEVSGLFVEAMRRLHLWLEPQCGGSPDMIFYSKDLGFLLFGFLTFRFHLFHWFHVFGWLVLGSECSSKLHMIMPVLRM